MAHGDGVDNNYETIGCGDPLSAVIVFTTFVVIVMLIFLNLFIAIVL